MSKPASAQPAAAPLTAERIKGIDRWLAAEVGARRAAITAAARLAGGSVQENWRVDAEIDGGAFGGSRSFVLRTDAAGQLALSLDRTAEFAVIAAAHKAGVKVAEPVARCADATLIGRPFLLQVLVPGVAQARRIVRDPELTEYGARLAAALGIELAKIHAIHPPRAELAFLPIPLLAPVRSEVARLRRVLDGAGEPRPALEYALAWLDANAPPAPPALSLVHGDFRTGNYLVENGRLMAVLDWEFAHWGDPREDIGWMCARCWRFGGRGPAGGIASRAALLEGYNSIAETPVAEGEVPFWEILAAARWAAIAVLQADRYRKGAETGIELALTGLMPPEMELDALDGIERIVASRGKRG